MTVWRLLDILAGHYALNLSETEPEIVPNIVPEIHLETIIVPEIVRRQQPEIFNEETAFL